MLITPKYARVVPYYQRGFVVPAAFGVAKNLLRYLFRGFTIATHNPRYAAAAAFTVLALAGNAYVGVWAAFVALGLGCLAAGVWAAYRPTEARQAILGTIRSIRKYRWGLTTRYNTWGATMRRCDTTKPDVPFPLLLTTRSTPYVDKLRVKIPTGLDPTAFQDYRGDLLRWAWGAQSVRVFNPIPKHQTVELWNIIRDPLIEPLPPFPKPAEALPKTGWALALVEDGEPWMLNIRDGAAHLFVCGISGAGKGSVIGALLDQAETGIEDKTVEVWGVDPQASELGMWEHRFARLKLTQGDAADMLEELVAIMNKRTRTMFKVARQHHPKPEDPFYLLILDEGLDLLDKTDRQLYRRIDHALRQLLRKGRKASIMVAFFSQRAELDIVEIRKDFPNSIALKLKQEVDVDMVLGRGALKAGADAHAIDTPGVAYVASDLGIMRVRFPYLSDDYIRELPEVEDRQPAQLPDDNDMGFA
jgi:DNA segregation ATPase FtsK/SpoIIIE, S-DNA-T family